MQAIVRLSSESMPDETRVPSFAPLKAELRGGLFDDLFARGWYATDASIYQMMPHAVVVPETLQDVEATLAFSLQDCSRVHGGEDAAHQRRRRAFLAASRLVHVASGPRHEGGHRAPRATQAKINGINESRQAGRSECYQRLGQ